MFWVALENQIKNGPIASDLTLRPVLNSRGLVLLLDELNENRPWDNYTLNPSDDLAAPDHCDTSEVLQNFRRTLS